MRSDILFQIILTTIKDIMKDMLYKIKSKKSFFKSELFDNIL